MGLAGGYVLVLSAVYAAFTIYLVRREVSSAHDRFLQTAQIVAAEMDAYIESGRQRLATVTALPGMAYGLRAIQEAKGDGYIPPWTTLHYLFFRSPVFAGGVFLVDHSGKVLWTEPPGLSWHEQTLGDDPSIAAVFRERHSVISAGYDADRLLDRPHVVVAAPIQNATGEIDGVLGGIIDLAAPEFTKILSAASTAEGRFVDVIDQSGRTVASTDPARRFQFDVQAAASGPLVSASASLSNAPWRVVAGQPRALGLAAVTDFQRILLMMGAALTLAAVAIAVPLINGFVRSIQALTAAAEVMARGELSQPVAVESRHDELATLARAFEQMRADLERSRVALEQRLEEREELIRLKEEFLANTSHELRTPLHVIIGYTDMLTDEPVSPAVHEGLTRIRTQSEHLFQLLTDLMSLSGLNAGKIALQVSRVDIPSLLARLSPLAEQLRHGKDIEIVWECDPSLPPVDTDALRLEQVLTNLVTNAFKFTAQGSVEIRARCHADQVSFTISDTGIGIPANEMTHIFDEFRQVDGSLHRVYGGVGLGLALVKKLTALLHGDVVVSSTVGQGSTFTVTIPVCFPGRVSASAA